MNTSPARVVVDGLGLSGYSAGRGIGTYLRGVLPELAQDPALDLTVLASKADLVPAGASYRPLRRFAPGRWADREHDLMLPWDLGRVEADVMLSPALDPPRRCSTPWVQTLHDVIPLDVNSGFTGERERWLAYRDRFQRAAHIIAVSAHCGTLAVDLLAVDSSKISVVHHGVDPAFSPASDLAQSPEPYLLYVGEYDARKGYREAFEVLSLVVAAGLPHRLKVAGYIAPWVRAEIEELVRASGVAERIDLLGHVHHTAGLPELYRGADVLTVTSRYEGFGLPAAEGMASGTPVVSFANTSLTEVVAHGGVLVEDGDVPAFAEAVIELLRNASGRAVLRARGLERAMDFTWQLSAARHAAVLSAAAEAG